MPTYRIIGADGKEYGPVTVDQMRQWIAEGRVNAQTQVLVEGTSDWRRAGDIPELNAALPIAPPTPPPGTISPQPPASLDQVAGPAIGLIVVGILNFLTATASLLCRLLNISMFTPHDLPNQAWVNMFASTVGTASNLVGILISGLIVFGAFKMRSMENFALAMTAAILAMIPCISPCCLIGLPIGIWALVVLSKPEVKAGFR